MGKKSGQHRKNNSFKSVKKNINKCHCFLDSPRIYLSYLRICKWFKGQFGYGGADDLWNVNGGVPFTAASSTGTTHNNNAYYVQVSNSFSINTYTCVCLSVLY